MSGTCRYRLVLGLIWMAVAAGCSTLPSSPALLDGGLVASSLLDNERERAAQAHALYALGIHHEWEDQFVLAQEAYQQASELDPSNERLILRIARTLHHQRKTEEALRTVESFVARYPASEKALGWLAAYYMSVDETDRGLELYRQLTRQFPRNPTNWLQLASAVAKSSEDTSAELIRTLELGIAKAEPSTALRQELVRIYLATIKQVEETSAKRQAALKAIEQLRKVLDDLPGDMDTLYVLGDLLVRNGDYDAAIEAYRKIERLAPEDLQVKQRLLRTYLAMDDQEQAINVIDSVVKREAGPSSSHYYMAELYLEAGEPERAAEQFRLALESTLEDPMPWLRLASLQVDEDPKEAIATLREALKVMPDNPKILEVLAFIYLANNQYAKAARLLDRAWHATIAEDPDAVASNLFCYNYATVCTQLRRTQEAADWLERALEQDFEVLSFYMHRALTGTTSFRQAATRVLQELSTRDLPVSVAIHGDLGTLHLTAGKVRQAVQVFERALEIVQADPLQEVFITSHFNFGYAVALDQSGHTDRAIGVFETVIAQNPEHAGALNYVAYLWAVRGERLKEAQHHVQAALALEPDNAAFLDTLGWVYFKMERYEEALELLEEADRLRPEDPEILDHIQQTREKLGH